MFRLTHPLFRRLWALLAVIVALAPIAVSQRQAIDAQAQINEPPIVLHIGDDARGDLWEWVGQGQPLKQLTNWKYNYAPVLSPDGSQVAYLSTASFVLDDIAKNDGHSGWPPANVWVLNLKTGNAFRVAEQPANASYDNHNYILRPRPAWSPDGKQLAWVELVAGGEANLVVYDVATQTLKTRVKDVPTEPIGAGLHGDSVSWSTAGLGYLVEDSTCNCDTPVITFYLYSATGKQLAAVKLSSPSNYSIQWANVGTKPIAVLNSGSYYDPADNSVKPLSGQLQAYSAAAPNAMSLDGGGSDNSTLSPDGKYSATITESGQFALYDQQGNATQIDLGLTADQRVDWIGWGPIAYRIVPQ